MKIWNFYKELLLIEKLDNNIKRYIFSFLIDDYKKNILENFICNKINIQKNNDLLTFHFNNMPYVNSEINNQIRKEINLLIIKNIKKMNLKHQFSHYCCNGQGLCYNIKCNILFK